jgi:hypothetical protein
MGVAIPQIITEDRAGGGQIIDGGLRFDSSKSQYLKKTFSSDGNRTNWTYSCWIKRLNVGSSEQRALVGSTSSNGQAYHMMGIEDDHTTFVYQRNVGNAEAYKYSSALFRDPSAWYHLVYSINVSTSSISLYVNGTQITSFSLSAFSGSFTQSTWNSGSLEHQIGAYLQASRYASMQLAQIYFIDGQTLDPSYFGYTDALTNTWRPKRFKPQATPNNGTVWSNDLTSNVGFYAGEGAIYAFDGDNTTYASVATGGASNYLNFSCNIPIASTLRVKVSTSTNYVYINGSGTPAVSGTGYLTVPTPPANLTQLRVYGDTGVGARIYAIEVDGIELLDSDTTNMGKNAFYLPLDGNTPIGQDQSGRGNNWTPVNFGGSNTLEKATGALPILNTDGGGQANAR